MVKPAYKRILLKISGEALMGSGSYGLDLPTVERIAGEIKEAKAIGTEVCAVIGGNSLPGRPSLGAARQFVPSATCAPLRAKMRVSLSVNQIIRSKRLRQKKSANSRLSFRTTNIRT